MVPEDDDAYLTGMDIHNDDHVRQVVKELSNSGEIPTSFTLRIQLNMKNTQRSCESRVSYKNSTRRSRKTWTSRSREYKELSNLSTSIPVYVMIVIQHLIPMYTSGGM